MPKATLSFDAYKGDTVTVFVSYSKPADQTSDIVQPEYHKYELLDERNGKYYYMYIGSTGYRETR